MFIGALAEWFFVIFLPLQPILLITIMRLRIRMPLRKRLMLFFLNAKNNVDGCIKHGMLIRREDRFLALMVNQYWPELTIWYGQMYMCAQVARKNLFFMILLMTQRIIK